MVHQPGIRVVGKGKGKGKGHDCSLGVLGVMRAFGKPDHKRTARTEEADHTAVKAIRRSLYMENE